MRAEHNARGKLTDAFGEVLLVQAAVGAHLVEPLLDGLPAVLATRRLVEEAKAAQARLRAGVRPLEAPHLRRHLGREPFHPRREPRRLLLHHRRRRGIPPTSRAAVPRRRRHLRRTIERNTAADGLCVRARSPHGRHYDREDWSGVNLAGTSQGKGRQMWRMQQRCARQI